MKVYLVGGAVRDKLLNLGISERDWVVVGSSPQEMLDLGYKQVGRDFPVFLHPQTKEEYALARTERKTGPGYHGFDFDYNAKVTLHEDLLRRDLTINAIAMDADGNIIDPYQGVLDLDNKVLRHVSEAFSEDPLRILRIARFAAQFYHLGFSIAPETYVLMRSMVRSGELNNLTPERVWQELKKSLLSHNPEIFICVLRECGALEQLLPELHCLFGVPATKKFHQEVDSGIHTLMVVQRAAQLSNDLHIRFAALVHDLGKGKVSMAIWPRQRGHDNLGADAVLAVCERYKVPQRLRKFALLVTKLHLQVHKVIELSAESILSVLELADFWRNPQYFYDLLLVAEADSLGKGLVGEYPAIAWFFPPPVSVSRPVYAPANMWQQIIDVLQSVALSEDVMRQLTGKEIQQQLRQQRLDAISQLINNWEQHA